MDDTLTEDHRKVVGAWGSEEALHMFLETEVQRLCTLICGAGVEPPRAEVRPSFLSRGLLGGKLRGGEYEPKDGSYKATIAVFPNVCSDRGLLSTVLAHELVHHWETISEEELPPRYPPEVDETIKEIFGSENAERSWRNSHSEKFISKGWLVTQQLGIPVHSFLANG